MSRYDDNLDNTAPHQTLQPDAAPPQAPLMPPIYPPPYIAPPQRRRKPILSRGCLGCLIALVALFGVLSCGCMAATLIGFSSLSNQWNGALDKAQKQLAPGTFQTTRVYDRNGTLLHELFDQGRRTNLKIADIPKGVIDATIATEDRSFYENPGIDLGATSRAILQLVAGTSTASGGSTITQQLVRNIAFDYQYRNERSARRKIEELGMAIVMTRQMSKDQILELYLNQIYYGNLAYGIEAAAQTYFGKHAKDLSLAEGSLLAGLPQAPAELDPLNPDPKIQDEVMDRRRIVLDAMVTTGKITHEQANAALATSLVYANPNVNLNNPHFTLYAEQELKDLITGLNLPPITLFTGGLTVYTTLDQRFQTLAEKTAQTQVASIIAQHNAHNATVVVLQPTTGQILAMVGSVNYNDASIQGKVNVATSLKQPGSAMKPLTYAAAMEKGFSAASILWDVETHIGPRGQQYSPVNYDGRFHGVVRVRDALANSYNIPAVETLRRIGVESLLSFAQRFGVRSLGTDASKFGLSLTLGGGELTPLELTQAYSVFANGGIFVPATSILCVVNGDGTIIYQYENGCPKGTQGKATINAGATGKQILDPRIAFIISDILADNNARSPAMGARSPLYTPNLPTSVKTGTTNDYRDNWTVGYTRNIAVGVWVGNTDNKPMRNSSGLTGAAPIWHDVITGVYADPALVSVIKHGDDAQSQPNGLVRKQICNLAALKDPASACAPGRTEWFLGSPAVVPDASGKLVMPPAVAPTQPPANGPRLTEIEPDVVQILVQPINPGVAAAFVPNPASGQAAPPPPLYCQVPNEVRDQVPSAQQQVFIRAPAFPDEDTYARIYAQNAGVPITPPLPCTAEMLSANPGAAGVVARITSPSPGQTVTGDVPVIGIVSFSPQQATYFKIEIQGPQFPQWTTIGDTHSGVVINGQLEHFGATGLQPGNYQLRIVVVGVDGNYLMTTGGVPIQVAG